MRQRVAAVHRVGGTHIDTTAGRIAAAVFQATGSVLGASQAMGCVLAVSPAIEDGDVVAC